MSIRLFNESFRRAYQKDTMKRKDTSLYDRIVESVERSNRNKGKSNNLSQFEHIIQDVIESTTGKNWYDVADNNMQQILFEEYDIKNAAKRLLHMDESEETDNEYEYKGYTIRFNDMGTAQIIDNRSDKVVRSGVSDAEAEEWIDSVTNESLKEEKIPETGEKVRTPRGTFSVTSFKKDELEKHGYGYHHSSDDGKYSIYGNGTDAYAVKNESVKENTEKTSKGKNEDWTSAYKNFEKIVDKFSPDEDKIQSEVTRLYNQHKGESDWDKAWEKWNANDKVNKRRGKRLTEMKVTEDIYLRDFEFWGGARDTVKYLTDDELDTIQTILEDSYPDGMTKTDINDFFWFDSDIIAEWLGYDDFEQIINRDDDGKGVDESFM